MRVEEPSGSLLERCELDSYAHRPSAPCADGLTSICGVHLRGRPEMQQQRERVVPLCANRRCRKRRG